MNFYESRLTSQLPVSLHFYLEEEEVEENEEEEEVVEVDGVGMKDQPPASDC